MGPTLLDIARATNLSVSTVSRALADNPGASRVSVETRAKIAAVAIRLGYRPNLLARSLRTRRTRTVALILLDITSPFTARLAALVEHSLRKHGYSTLLLVSGEDVETERDCIRTAVQRTVDGILIVPTAHSSRDLLAEVPGGFPLVVIDHPLAGIDASVACNPVTSATQLCDALESGNVRTVSLVTAKLNAGVNAIRANMFRSRFEVLDTHEASLSPDTGRDAAGLILHRQTRPDAIVCTSSTIAMGLLEAMPARAAMNGVVIATFDHIPLVQHLHIPIVSAVHDARALAEESVFQLLPLLKGEPVSHTPIVLKSSVVMNEAFRMRMR
jgi:LacI family transcriptional regulator